MFLTLAPGFKSSFDEETIMKAAFCLFLVGLTVARCHQLNYLMDDAAKHCLPETRFLHVSLVTFVGSNDDEVGNDHDAHVEQQMFVYRELPLYRFVGTNQM